MNCLRLFNLLALFSSSIVGSVVPREDCFMHGLQIAGVLINDPLQSITPSPEACQMFCQVTPPRHSAKRSENLVLQTVFDCVAFSWVDDSYSLENERLT